MSLAFRYRASTATGTVVEGVVQAASQSAALDELRRQTLFPVSVDLVAPASATTRGASVQTFRSRAGRASAVAASMRILSTLIAAGTTLDRALDFTSTNATHPEVAAAFAAVRSDVQGGSTVAESMQKQVGVFGSLAVSVVRAGEESGTLDVSLARLADHLDQVGKLRAELRSTLVYPALMGIVAGVGVTILLAFVVPRFVGMLADVGGQLPLSTRLLLGASDLVARWWWIWIPAIALTVAGMRAWLAVAANRLRYHRARLAWPLVGDLELKLGAARFARTLGLLLTSGMGMLRALRIARLAVGNEALGARLLASAEKVERGGGVSDSLKGVLPPLAVQLFAVGEESGRLDELCLRVADTYDGEVQRSLRTLVSLVQPALIIAFGGIVGFIALAMLQAIYSINASAL